MPAEKNEFLFTESEFEDESFLAPSFVSKYRRVTSTESLKDELLVYSNALKQQLYDIINRDYKDFITISTKLDGVDQRVSILKKPLKDLQTNMFIFHEGVLSSMQALQDKIRDRSEVSNRKLMVVTLLSCIEQVEVIQRVLHHATNTSVASASASVVSNSTAGSSSSSKRENLLKLLDRKLAHSSSTSSSTNLIKKDIFICSEYERAAYCLRSLQNNIATVTPLVGSASNPSVEKLFGQLKLQCSELTGYLVEKIRTKLSHILSSVLLKSSHSTSASDVTASSAVTLLQGEDQPDHSVSYAHCIRALLVLSRGEVAENVVKVDVIDPFVKQFLTAGRLDGKGGRGSYLGLQVALESIVTAIRESQLKSYLNTTEELIALQPSTAGAGVDVLTNGVYAPILSVLHERCSTMYSIAIANTLSSCYSAVGAFHQQLFSVVHNEHAAAARARISRSQPFVDFHKRWKLDMYYSLRYNEIANRVDKICDVVNSAAGSTPGTGKGTSGGASTAGAHQSLLRVYHKNLADHIFDPPTTAAAAPVATVTPSKAGVTTAAAAPTPAPAPLTLTLTPTEYDQLKSSLLSEIGSNNNAYHYSLFTLFSLELLTSTHSKVALPPLVHKFVAFCLKINVRLDYHIRLLCELTGSSAGGVSAVEASSVALPESGTATPIKKNTPTGSLSQSPLTVTSTGNLVGATATATAAAAALSSSSTSYHLHLSLDELCFMVHDLYQFGLWLAGPFKQRVFSLLLGTSSSTVSASSCPPLDASFALMTEKLQQTRLSIIARFTTLLMNDCKQPLAGAVKAIAGKYRMTNKPPPDAASQYVETLLQPLRVFLTSHEKVLSQVLAERTAGCYSFALQVVNETATHFLDNVRALLESVKQQDSTLMRRTKLATNTKAGALSDTEKIILQVQLDVKLFGQEVGAVCKLSAEQVTELVPVFVTLTNEVVDAQNKLQAATDK